MASTSVSNITTNGCSWSITGLQAPFNEYLAAGVALSSVSSGSSSPPSNVLDTVSPASGDTSYSASGSVSGLSSGTQYTFYGFARSANGLYYPAGSDSFTTSYSPPSPPSFFSSSSYQNTITILFSEGVGATSTQLEYGISGQSTSYKSTSSDSFYLTGLSYDTLYTFRLRSYNSTSGLYSSWTDWYSRETEAASPPPDPPYNISHLVNGNQCTISFTKGAYADSTSYEYKYPGQSNYTGGQTWENSFTLTGLWYSTTYEYKLKSYGDGGSSNWTTTKYFTTDPEPQTRPSDFSWTYAKTSGQNFKLTASEWNSFTSRINAFRTYKNLSTVSFTTAVDGNDFTATIFNQARNALGSLSSYFTGGKTIPSTKSKDDDIYASYLNDLVSAMNSIQ